MSPLHSTSKVPLVSIIIPTYRRAKALPRVIGSALDQTFSPQDYEVLVVDNNSPDDTADVIERIARQHPGRVRRIFETRQGVSYARQAGIDQAQGDIIAFFDDDVRVAPTWVETIVDALRSHPEVQCVGGKVLPVWPTPPPAWLTPDHWAPLALQDFGDQPMLMSSANPRGLISANLACRKEVLQRVGGFSPELQRVKDGIGSLEDDDWNRRFWKTGGVGLYWPSLVAWTEVPADRLTRAYHRRWHLGHGRFYALLRAEEIERTNIGRFLGVPAHLYRSAFADAAGLLASVVRGRGHLAFLHEVRLRFFGGFVVERVRTR
jgi:glycosyltransferase involved in cell wall biosynthesis